jgi:NAD+ synthase (glutamine-hydrolysing)
MKYGFVKVAAAVPAVKVADVTYNVQEIERLITIADVEHVEVVVFPELSITGYTCQDLFRERLLLDKAEEGLLKLIDFTRKLDIISVVGMPIEVGSLLLNCAVVLQQGCILAVVPKSYLPNYGEFY